MPGKAPIKAVVVHDLEQARVALAAARAVGRPITLLSAPAAANAVGPAWFATLIRTARAEFPDLEIEAILDCDRAAGRAMAALQAGFNGVVFTGSNAVLLKLADIGEDKRCTLYDMRPEALDLMDQADPAAACRAWLGG
jgi:fructose/tagatose bisphosphate aldolase